MWKFAERNLIGLEYFPRECELFNSNNSSESLVREFIQNSLDAKYNNEKVVIDFKFGKKEYRTLEKYFEGLSPHLKESGLPDPKEYLFIDYLVIEEFGTTGLDGEINSKTSNFYNFWFREGLSNKTGIKSGRWGLGKTTYYSVSKIKAFWGYTIQRDTQKSLLMGRATMKPHSLDNKEYDYYAFYVDNNKPIDNPFFINDFKSSFDLIRQNEPGFSLVIPLTVEEIDYDEIILSIFKNYFYAILNDLLIIRLHNDNKLIEINKDNFKDKLSELCSDYSKSDNKITDLLKMVDFVKDTFTCKNIIRLENIADYDPFKDHNVLNEKKDYIKKGLNNNEIVCFEIPLTINKNQTFYKIFLKQYPENGFDLFIRSGILIKKVKTSRPFIAMLLAEDKEIVGFLGDCETPAHNDWSERVEDFKKNYKDGAKKLRFIKKSIDEVVKYFNELKEDESYDFLSDIFYISNKPVGRKLPPVVDIKNKTDSDFEILKEDAGFKIKYKKTDIELNNHPKKIKIVTAYKIRRGDPFNEYNEFDFDFKNNNFIFNKKDCNITLINKNTIEIEIYKPEFQFFVKGFDKKRDLVVNIIELNNVTNNDKQNI